MKKILLFLVIVVLTAWLAIAVFFKEGKVIKSQPQTTKVINVNNFQTQVIAEGLDTPWAIAFLPDKNILVSERPGRVRIIENGKLLSQPIAIIGAREIGEGGLLGITLHPNFSTNKYVYIYYTYGANGDNTLNRVARMTLRQTQDKAYQLTDEKIIVDSIPGASNHNGGRIKFGPDGFLYITTGDAQDPSLSQDINSLAGKILRITDDGKIAPGNPFNNFVYSYGHRNPQGLVWDQNSRLWATEHGPSAQDEINMIEAGKNYGWPESVGNKVQDKTVAPLIHSGVETWAPAGTAFIDNFLFFGGLRGQTLFRAVIENNKIKEIKKYFDKEFGRIREVIVGPDNMLYLSTSNKDGRGNPTQSDDRIIRIDPKRL